MPGSWKKGEIMSGPSLPADQGTPPDSGSSSMVIRITPSGSSKEGVPVPWSGFRYAMCNESMQGMKWKEQCELVAQAGYRGIEVAPFILVEKGIDEITLRKRKAMLAAMKNKGIECVGLHWLLSPPPRGLHFTSPAAGVRRRTLDYVHKLIDFCGDLGGKSMVFGAPKGRDTEGKLSVAEATKNLADGLVRIADHAQQRGLKILLEPLGHDQTDVVNTLSEAMKVIKEIHHPAIETIFDFHNTLDEQGAFHELIERFFIHIYHVHVQEMDGKFLGAGEGVKKYVQAFQTLKDRKYDKWVSVEVFDFSSGPKTIAKESMRALKAIEGKLK
jgi:D-psicose/D-tagatose/L-ribulose 3-epimerase